MSATMAIVLALFCLASGGFLGFLIGRGGASSEAKRAEALEEEFSDYRRNVTEHFGETAEHFRNIGRQYRDLYEHMASGADALCNDEDRARLAFPSLRAIEGVAATTVAGVAGASVEAGEAVEETAEAAPPEAEDTPEAVEASDLTVADAQADAEPIEDAIKVEVEIEVIDDEPDEAAVAETEAQPESETVAGTEASAGEEPEAKSEAAEDDDAGKADPESLRNAGAT
ncbi:MAG: DUF1043 family protein [Pseudomonadota bacterium]